MTTVDGAGRSEVRDGDRPLAQRLRRQSRAQWVPGAGLLGLALILLVLGAILMVIYGRIAPAFFKGETLRGLLLNAYAFGKMGTIAGIGAIVAWVGGALFAALGALGLWYAHRVPVEQEVLAGKKAKHTVTEPAIAD